MSFLILPEGFCKKQIYLFFIYLVSIVSVKKYKRISVPSNHGNLFLIKGHKVIMSIVTIRGLYVLYTRCYNSIGVTIPIGTYSKQGIVQDFCVF